MNKLITLGLLLLSTISFAQQSVNGKVTDATSGEPLLGATVVVKGTNRATTTDFDGLFTVRAEVDEILVVSYVGYKTNEVAINASGTMNISLAQDIAGLDAVIVVGYGTQSVKEITGAVSVVNEATIENLKPVRIEQALQGQVPGIQITSQSGAPGASSNIRIRGVSTNGDSRPLILLDGAVIEDLSVVNPGDVESISVLKDATAGIYGVRGANGVIIITTKNGRKNQPLTVDYDAYAGFQQASRRLPTLNLTEYALIINESFTNNGQQAPFNNVQNLPYTDYQDKVLETAPIFSNNIGIKAGTENSAYSFGASLLRQDGVVGLSKSGFTRSTLRFNFDHNWTDNLSMKTGVLYTRNKRSTISENALGSVLFNAVNMNPTIPVRNANGDFSIAENLGNEVINPLAQLANTFNDNYVDKITGNFGLSYKFLNGFEANARIQVNYAEVNGDSFAPIANYGSGKVFNNDTPVYNTYSQYFRDYTYDAFLKYEHAFAKAHNVEAVVGLSAFRSTGKLNGFTGRYDIAQPATAGINFSNASLSNADTVEDNFVNGNDQFDSRLWSQFARLQYDYKETYLFSAVMRRDGSTAFGPKNKFGYFPSASLGWVASNEGFLSGSSAVSFLKFRASYGILGNDRIPPFRYISLLNAEGEYIFNDQLVFGAAAGALSKPEITWEEQYSGNVGFDANFLGDKLTFTADYFNKKTEDLLVVPTVSGTLGVGAPGASPPFINGGDIRNQGFEFALSYGDKTSDDFNYRVSYNVDTLKNEVLSVENSVGFIEGGNFGVGQPLISRMAVGQPIGAFFGYQTNGIFQTAQEAAAAPSQIALGAVQQPGDLRYVDLNGDGVITTADRTYIGDPLADVTMGLNLNFNYKNWDFQSYLYASLGNDIVRNYERNQSFTNTTTNELNRWTGPGSTNEFPRVTNGANSNGAFSEFFVEDGSFLRLQNVQLGYTIDNDFVNRNSIKQLRFYASANNLITLTKYRGFDPSASNGAPIGSGIDNGFYPLPRTIIVGANVKF